MAPEYPAVCFATRTAPTSVGQPPQLRLAALHQEALADLLPVLLCGEESAALAFARFSGDCEFSQRARAELQQIGNDERQHEAQLQALRQALPPATGEDEVRRAARRFFARAGGRDPGKHFARILALDSGVCVLLGALRGRGLPLATDGYVSAILARIHRDEVRHVMVSRRYAGLLLEKRQAYAVAQEMRERLAVLMALRGAALETLGVDTDRLLGRLRRVPRALSI